MITIEVRGVPRPQGSMKLFRAKAGHEVAKYSDTVYRWRGTVTDAVQRSCEGPPLDGALDVSIVFALPRPAGHFGTGRNAGTLRPSAPMFPAVAPDLDKLVRAVLDAVTDAGTVWHDDGQVVGLMAVKTYASDVVGCVIRVKPSSETCTS